MREVTVEFLHQEASRLQAMVVLTRIFDGSGVKIHSPGDVLSLETVKMMLLTGIQRVFLPEPGDNVCDELGLEMVAPADLSEGETLAEEVRGANGKVLFSAGTPLGGPALDSLRGSTTSAVLITQGADPLLLAQARAYVARVPPAPPRFVARDTGGGTVVAGPKPLLTPRGKVLITFTDDMVRGRLAVLAADGGHEVVQHPGVTEIPAVVRKYRPDVLIMPVAEVAAAMPELRKMIGARPPAMIACAEEARKAELFKALQAGANDSLYLPPQRDQVLDKIRGALQVLGRWVRMKPGMKGDRRATARQPGGIVCHLKDTYISKPLQVSSATLLDLSEGGVKIEYGLLTPAQVDTYAPHSVHPRHFWYHYSKGSPLARDLTVSLPGPTGKSFESFARVVYVTGLGVNEVAGLAFSKRQEAATRHMTTVRARPAF